MANSKKVTKVTLIDRILSILNLDDHGKVASFFKGEVKKLQNAVRQLESNEKQEDLRNELALEALNEKIEDAQQDVDDAYLAVKVENIQSNEDKKNFSTSYWNNISSKEYILKDLKRSLENKLEAIEDSKKDLKEQKVAYAARIKKITS